MKPGHMANHYTWGDDRKLNTLVEALKDKVPTSHGNLLANVH